MPHPMTTVLNLRAIAEEGLEPHDHQCGCASQPYFNLAIDVPAAWTRASSNT
jgi:hypothetical protein